MGGAGWSGSWPEAGLLGRLRLPERAAAPGRLVLPAWARSRSSGVCVHRQWKSESASPVMPPVRTSVNTPHASRMAATIDARRGPLERRRLATAQATKARLRTGMA